MGKNLKKVIFSVLLLAAVIIVSPKDAKAAGKVWMAGFKKVKTVKVSKKKSYSFQITKNGKKKFKKGTYYVQVTPKVKFGNKTYSSDVSTVASAYVYK